MTLHLHTYANGWLVAEGFTLRCALGKGGIKPAADKREGDGASPAGCYAVRRIWYRADKLALPKMTLPVRPITPNDGWCDAPEHTAYNTHVLLPFDASHERLWREDDVYDIVVELGHNDSPPKQNMGSCIFMHVARPAYQPTEGCVALELTDLLKILPQLTLQSTITIHNKGLK